MKRSVVLTILGIGMAVASTASVHAQGGIIIGNYQAPFNKVVWGSSVPAQAGTGVRSTQGVSLSLWFGEGVLAGDQLVSNIPLQWKTDSEGLGYFGYYFPTQATLTGWATGETWTFQVRASGTSSFGAIDGVSSRSSVWTETADIKDISGNPPGLPGVSSQSIGFVVNVPEPTTFALAGLGGLAALMTYRRRS